MWRNAAQRRFDVLLFWALDRFSRDGVLETLNYLQRLTSYGINWRSHLEKYLDSTGMFRDAVIAIPAAVAN
jgi:DNA invertase Pin-like site-specific DNA recombinase